MKGLVILGNGFEDTEAIATIDVLKRSKLIIDTASVNETLDVISQCDIRVMANVLLKDVNPKDYDFLVIPGGRAVFSVLDKNANVSKIIKQFVEDNKLVAAICAGPSQVGKLGYYKNISYTCFPGAEKSITEGKHCPHKSVISEGNFITAKSMAYACDFALEIIEFLQGKEQRKIIDKSIHGEL